MRRCCFRIRVLGSLGGIRSVCKASLPAPSTLWGIGDCQVPLLPHPLLGWLCPAGGALPLPCPLPWPLAPLAEPWSGQQSLQVTEREFLQLLPFKQHK